MKTFLNIFFIAAAFLTMLEYYFICGLFTGPLMMVIVFLIGIINVFYSALHDRKNEAILYVIAIASLCLGYIKLM